MERYLASYLKWIDELLFTSGCTLQAKIIIYDTLRIFYKEDCVKLREEILSVGKDCIEVTSKFYALIFNLLVCTEEYSLPSCYTKEYVDVNIHKETFEKDNELVKLYNISCNKKKFKTSYALDNKNTHRLEARMLLEYEKGDIENGNMIFRTLANFGDVYNPVMDSAYRKLLSKQNPIGFWGAYSKTKFTPEETASLLNIGFGTLRTLKEYKEPNFCLF